MSKAMLWWQTGLVALQVMSGGAVLGEFIESRWIGMIVLSVAALQAATAFYERGKRKGAQDADV